VVQVDAKRLAERKKSDRTPDKNSVGEQSHGLKGWQKKCPGCGKTVHVRKKTCDCGQKLL
jgi:rRNA maturation endonuclease Nob1